MWNTPARPSAVTWKCGMSSLVSVEKQEDCSTHMVPQLQSSASRSWFGLWELVVGAWSLTRDADSLKQRTQECSAFTCVYSVCRVATHACLLYLTPIIGCVSSIRWWYQTDMLIVVLSHCPKSSARPHADRQRRPIANFAPTLSHCYRLDGLGLGTGLGRGLGGSFRHAMTRVLAFRPRALHHSMA